MLPFDFVLLIFEREKQKKIDRIVLFQLFTTAESLGGYESLVELPAVMTHASVPEDHRRKLGITDGLIRISVGLENTQDLINDIEQALEYAFSAADD